MTRIPEDMREHNRALIEDFRTNGAPQDRLLLLLLTTTGARTGERRTTPMMFVPDGDRLLVIASNAGAARHPAWYQNLAVNPQVSVEVGAEVYDATAVVTTGEERDRLFASIVERYPFFADHQAGVSRTISVVALVRIAS